MENCSFLRSPYLGIVKSYFSDNEWAELDIIGRIEAIILYEIYKVQKLISVML